jgi:hypothetical protein
MKILLSSYYLDLSGVPTYTLTLYRELLKRNHTVAVYTIAGGELENHLITCRHLPECFDPDVIIAQGNTCAEHLRAAYPHAPLIFSAHGITPGLEQPPACAVDRFTAINEDGRDHLIEQGIAADQIDLVRDFVDVEQYLPTTDPHDRLRRVLYVSNRKKGATYQTIAQACSELRIELKCVGAPYGRARDMAATLNRTDLVIATGRSLLEAMACGRPVISFDEGHGDGYLTPDLYMESRTRNFAGEKCRHAFTPAQLVNELKQYLPVSGAVNRALAYRYHSHITGVDHLLRVVEVARSVRQPAL